MIDSNKLLNNAISMFDFEKVHEIMTYLNWKWRDKVPSIEEMKDCVKMLYNDANSYAFENNLEEGKASTGGFEVIVTRYKDDNNNYQLSIAIHFLLEEYEVDSEEENDFYRDEAADYDTYGNEEKIDDI